MNFYERFQAASKEELYLKVKDRDPEVRELIDFLEFSKASIKPQNDLTNRPELLAALIENSKIRLENDEIKLFFIDVRYIPRHLVTVTEDKTTWKSAINEGLNANTIQVFLYAKRELKNTLVELEGFLRFTGFKVADVLLKDKGRYFSKRANYYLDSYEIKALHNKYTEEKKPELLDHDYKDFARYYAKEELKDLDVLHDSEKIDELLKQGYQYLDRERFGLLVIDENRKVKNLVEVSLGAIDRTLADTSIIVKTLLNEDAKGVIFFHNHPTGNTKPSEDDIKVSTQLVKACNQIDIEVYASKVVGKEGVTNFEPNYDLYENSLYTTQEIMMAYKSLALDR